MNRSEELVVRRIRDGTVIDHITAGQALNVLKILGIGSEEKNRVALVMNAESRKLGKKDIVKIEGRELLSEEVNRIALIAPQATINTIRDYQVKEKVKVKLPERIEGIIKCMNPNCISNKPDEPLMSSFKLLPLARLLLVCEYCGTYLTHEEVVAQYAAGRA